MKTTKGLGKGDSSSASAPPNTPRAGTWTHGRRPVRTHFISACGSATFPGLAKPTQSQPAAVVLMPTSSAVTGQG